MNGSLQIGTAFGIPIRLHWSLLLLLLFMASSPFMLLGVFLSVLLHELGHSLMAKRFGIQVIDITFWPLGGMARMTDVPEDPKIEGLVAIAGPMVNFILAAITFTIMVPLALAGWNAPAFFLTTFLVVNMALGTFNLLPAFPMDGGRILRAWLARKRSWLRATEIAVASGRWVAGGMALLPLVLGIVYPSAQGGFCMMPAIALFLWFAGGRELLMVRLRHNASPFGAATPTGFDARPAGPTGAQKTVEHHPGHGGFDEQDVRELERFRGRLKRPE